MGFFYSLADNNQCFKYLYRTVAEYRSTVTSVVIDKSTGIGDVFGQLPLVGYEPTEKSHPRHVAGRLQ